MRRFILGLALLLVVVPRLSAQVDPARAPRLLLGVAWYPEHWPEERWEQDLKLMQAAGIRVVRIGEFAWSRLEPSEGQFDLDWLERVVALAAKHNIACVLGTGTAAPPAWLVQKYPEIVRTTIEGRTDERAPYHYRFTSQRYREYCRRLAETMAARFGHNPSVIGWQIDNEYGEDSWDDDTRAQFQEWLKRKYGTLDEVNRRWTTGDFSQTYSDWTQIPLGRRETNPGVFLAFKRFVTNTYKDYQHIQVEAIRKHSEPRQFITTNYIGWSDRFDHYVLSEELDFAAWDIYVSSGHFDPTWYGLVHDLHRGLKRKNFWVMESQSTNTDWAPVNNALDRGEVRTMAWHAVGHGADAVSYWQWRSPLNGVEQYFGVPVGADGTPNPVYEEITRVGGEFAKAERFVAGTSPVSEVALLHSYDSRWAVNLQRLHERFEPGQALASCYRPLRAMAQQMDVVHPMAPLSDYKLVVAPALNVLTQEVADHLVEYVEQGGHLVLGPRTGMKDEFNALHTARQPGRLLPAVGARVEQFYALDENVPLAGTWGQGKATIWAEQLSVRAKDIEVLLTYGPSNGWLDGQPAAVTRRLGRGRITYIGAWLDEKLMAAAARWMLESSGVAPALGTVPEPVEVCRRVSAGKEVFILINHSKQAQQVRLPRRFHRVLAEDVTSRTLDLPPRGVEVLTTE